MMTQISEQAIVTLLDDTDELTVAEAMRLVLEQHENPAMFIAAHQDDDSPLIRRHVQQLSYLLYHRKVHEAFLMRFHARKLTFWDGLFMISLMSDGRSNPESLKKRFEEFSRSVIRSRRKDNPATTGELIQAVRESILHVPHGFDFFKVFNLFLPDILDTGDCHPLVLCEIIRQIGARVGWAGTIVMYNGMYMLNTPENSVLAPDNDWNAVQNVKRENCHVCTHEELLKAFVGLMHMMSIVSRRPIGIYGSSRLMTEMFNLNQDNMAYPIGTRKLVSDKK